MRHSIFIVASCLVFAYGDDPFREDLPQFVDSYMTNEKMERWTKLVQPFSFPMDDFAKEKHLIPWTAHMRKTLEGRMYLEELANLMHDAVDLLENIDVPTEMIIDDLRLFLLELDLKPPILSLRYLGSSDRYEKDILAFGDQFNAHLNDLLDVVEANEHEMFLEDLTQDIIELRHWLDKRWTRSRGRKNKPKAYKDVMV
ncbi:hypothetical protein AAVH_13409, partial [Aphelenchoides avenae]